jgi:hypothetical protein
LIVACSCYENFHIYSTSSGTYIYFINDNGNLPSLEKVSINGGIPTLIYQGSGSIAGEDPVQMTIYQSYIYWLDVHGGIGKVPLNGGTAQVLYGGNSCEVGYIFGPTYTDSTLLTVDNGFIYSICGAMMDKISINGGPISLLFTASSGYAISGLAYYSGKIFFSYDNDDLGESNNTGGIYSVSSSGGTASLLVVSKALPISLAVSSGKVYYINLGTGKSGQIAKESTGSVKVFTP